MEDLWKVQDLGYRVGDWAERAEYAKLLRSFRDQEHEENRRQLLCEGETLGSAGRKRS